MSSSEETITTAIAQHPTNGSNNGFNGNAITTAATIIYTLTTMPLHIFVTWLIVTGAGKGVASEFFVLNLSICEILCGLGVSFLTLFELFYPFVLNLKFFFVTLLFSARPLLQSCICAERYLAVLHPVLFLKYKPLRYKVLVSCLTWLIIISSSLISALLQISSTPAFSFNLSTFPLMLFCCLAIIRALKQPGPGGGRREVNQAKMKAFKIILAILVSQLINLMTSTAEMVIIHSITSITGIMLTYMIAFFIMMLTGLIYPLQYLHTTDKLPCKPASHTTH